MVLQILQIASLPGHHLKDPVRKYKYTWSGFVQQKIGKR